MVGRTLKAALSGLCAVALTWMLPAGAAAYSWSMNLNPAQNVTLTVFPGDSVDFNALIFNDSAFTMTIQGTDPGGGGGCVDLGSPPCTGNEGETSNVDTVDPNITYTDNGIFDGEIGPSATVSFLIGNLLIGAGAPTNFDFNVIVQVNPDPQFEQIGDPNDPSFAVRAGGTPDPEFIRLSVPVHIAEAPASGVPEPATLTLVAVGLGGLFLARRRRGQ